MLNYLVGAVAVFGYIAFLAAYMRMRPKGALSVMDMFVFMFSLQFGPHSIFVHPFLEDRDLALSVYPAYALGLALAFGSLALGLFFVGALAGTRTIRMYPLLEKDISAKKALAIIILGLIYIALFIAYQGFDLSRTISYLNFFQGSSAYTYTELRREVYEDDAGVGLSAVTRQTSSALLYGALIYVGLRFSKLRIASFAVAAVLFIVCCMQMNKFPFLYYALITAMIVFAKRCYGSGKFLNKSVVYKAILAGVASVLLLGLLYWVQYRSEIASGIVTSDRILFRLISRPFAGNHGSLYYWYDVFPDKHDFVGFASVPALADAFGLKPIPPTILVPSYYLNVNTTFQAGYIGGAYAAFGYPGIFLYSLFVGGWVCMLTRFEKKFEAGWQRVIYLSVVGVNMYFLSSRELHTAMQSGGFVVAPLIMLLMRRFGVSARKVVFAGSR